MFTYNPPEVEVEDISRPVYGLSSWQKKEKAEQQKTEKLRVRGLKMVEAEQRYSFQKLRKVLLAETERVAAELRRYNIKPFERLTTDHKKPYKGIVDIEPLSTYWYRVTGCEK